MSIEGMMHLSGIETVETSGIARGWIVRHYGTKRWGIVQKVIPQHDRTKELIIKYWPVRYDSLSHHLSQGGHYNPYTKQSYPCTECCESTNTFCKEGLRSKNWDENTQWATYHLDRCFSPEALGESVKDHRENGCHLCNLGEFYKKPCRTSHFLEEQYKLALEVQNSTYVEGEDDGSI